MAKKVIITFTEHGPEVEVEGIVQLHEMIALGTSLLAGSIEQIKDKKEGGLILEETINLLRD